REVTRSSCELLLERQRQGAAPLPVLNPRVDAPLAHLVEQCLAFDPRKRPASAAALAQAFRAAGQARRPRRRRPVLRIAAAAALLTLATLGVALAVLPRQPAAVRQLHLGRERFEAGQYAQAISHFSQSLEADPAQPEVYFARARAHQHGG